MEDCPNFEGCNAPLCPLDPDWQKRTHLAGDKVCYYINTYAKTNGAAYLRYNVRVELYEAIAEHYPAISAHNSPLRYAVKRAAKTPLKRTFRDD